MATAPRATTAPECAHTTLFVVLQLLIASVLAGVTPSVAQTTIERIYLPDSAGVAGTGRNALYWPDLNRTYFGGDAGIGVLAGPQGRRVRRINEDGMMNGDDWIYGDTAARRLVHACGYDTLTYIFDPDADTVVATARIPGYAIGRTTNSRDACVDIRNHQLFVCYQMIAGGPDGIAVYDLLTGALIDTMTVPLGKLCSNPTSNRLYVLEYGTNRVGIYDASTRTHIKTLQMANGTSHIDWLAAHNKVYVTVYFGANVTIIDGAGDSVICELGTPVGPQAPTMNEREGNVMVTTDAGFVVIDGAGDSVRTLIPASRGSATGWSSATNKYYCSYRGGFKVVDGHTDSLLADQPGPVWASGVTCNTRENIIYFCSQGWQLLAVDGSGDTALWCEFVGRSPGLQAAAWSRRWNRCYFVNTIGRDVLEVGLSGTPPRSLSHSALNQGGAVQPALDSGEAKLYAVVMESETLVVVGCSTMTVTGKVILPHPSWYRPVAMPALNRIFQPMLSGDGAPPFAIAAIDMRSDSVVDCYDTPDSARAEFTYCVSSTSHKVYWAGGGRAGGLVVLDANRESVAFRPLTDNSGVVDGLAWRGAANQVYASTNEGLKVVDCATDSVVETVAAPQMVWMCYVDAHDKVYGITSDGWSMRVLACSTNRQVARLTLPFNPTYTPPVYCPQTDRVYAVTWTAPPGQPIGVRYWVVAIDCATDEVAEWFEVTYAPHTLTVVADSAVILAACENSALYVIRDAASGLSDRGRATPSTRPALSVRPSPAAGDVLLSATLAGTGPVTLSIYDATGRKVASLLDEPGLCGRVQVLWNGTDGVRPLAAGPYFARLRTAAGQAVAKVVLSRR